MPGSATDRYLKAGFLLAHSQALKRGSTTACASKKWVACSNIKSVFNNQDLQHMYEGRSINKLQNDIILPHPVQLQCHELYHRSETGPSRLLAHVRGTNFHHRFVTFILLLLLNINLRHFYTIMLLIHIVGRPCCISALTSP